MMFQFKGSNHCPDINNRVNPPKVKARKMRLGITPNVIEFLNTGQRATRSMLSFLLLFKGLKNTDEDINCQEKVGQVYTVDNNKASP